MIARILKSNQPIAFLITLIVGVGLWLYTFIEPVPMYIPTDNFQMPLYNLILNLFNEHLYLSIGFTLLLILAQALILVQFNKKYIVINYRTYLPAFIYIMIVSSFPALQRLNPVVIGAVFLFISIDFIYGTYRKDYALNRLFLAGFFIAIATLIWAPFAVFFIIIWISLTILRPFIGREWIVSLLGFIAPFWFLGVYFYVFDEQSMFSYLNNFTSSMHIFKHFHHLHYAYYIYYGILFLFILAASFNILSEIQKKKIKTRKFFQINWWMFVLGVFVFVLFRNVKYEIIYVLSIPLSFLLTDYIYAVNRNWKINTIILLLILSQVYIQIIAHY